MKIFLTLMMKLCGTKRVADLKKKIIYALKKNN